MTDSSQGQDSELLALAERLERERPVPAPGFRGELHRRLTALGARPRPSNLGARIALLGSGGGLCLLTIAGGVAGIGPLAA